MDDDKPDILDLQFCDFLGAIGFGKGNAIDTVRDEIAEHLDEIRLLFKPGVKITVLVRTPDYPDRDFMLSDDDLGEVSAMVGRSAGREAK